MTSNQRRPGFRLPWSSEDEAAAAAASQAAPNGTSAPEDGPAEESELEAPAATATAPTPAQAETPAPEPVPASAEPAVAEAEPAKAPSPETSAGFMRDLVEAMRRVAEETRQAGLSDLRTKSDERVRTLEEESERRREELRASAETDIAAVGEWSRTEQERITREAEQKVVGRRAELDQQLAAEASRAASEAQALRDRVTEYERDLDAYHAQLSDIADPAAFAAAAKRMPAPPRLGGPPAPSDAPEATDPAEPVALPEANGESAAPDPVPAETEVLSARLAELDATLDAADAPAQPEPEQAAGDATEATDSTVAPVAPVAPDAPKGETVATEVLVKGLGSFGAITGFRQALASVDGIDGVSLSLGPTGEFVFRAIHPAGFDVAGAITAIEGDAATIEERPEGGLRVTLDRAR
ncbi:MAG: hypothetical protein ACRDFY_10675 [Candidatus Limnocylindria bacterium]